MKPHDTKVQMQFVRGDCVTTANQNDRFIFIRSSKRELENASGVMANEISSGLKPCRRECKKILRMLPRGRFCCQSRQGTSVHLRRTPSPCRTKNESSSNDRSANLTSRLAWLSAFACFILFLPTQTTSLQVDRVPKPRPDGSSKLKNRVFDGVDDDDDGDRVVLGLVVT